jgi:hypothetical protein
MPYQYDIKDIKVPEPNIGKAPYRTGIAEVLSGTIQNKTASDLEERFSRSMNKLEVEYLFRARITTPYTSDRRLTRILASLPGELEVDFLAKQAMIYPIMIDGEIAHFKTKWQADLDAEKEYNINQFGKLFGWHEAVRIPFWELKTQDLSDRKAREVFI